MNSLTMILPLLCFTSMCLLVANTKSTFKGYRYDKPSIAFEHTTATKEIQKLAKTADIKSTAATISTKSERNSATETTFTTATQHQEKSHQIKQIVRTTVLNPTAKEKANLNRKSNKNPTTATNMTTTSTVTTADSAETITKIKKDKLNLNKLPNNSNGNTVGGSLYLQQKKGHFHPKNQLDTQKPVLTLLAFQEAALENFLNRDNEFIYRLSTNADHRHTLERLNSQMPMERRLSPYTEIVVDREYFE